MNLEEPKQPKLGIMFRTALLAWLVALGTLLIFVVVIVPQQKRIFLENLESKAHGVAVSLRDIAAGAAVNEDFGSVVDYCNQMLNGDRTLDYLVVTKSDGFSLMSDRTGWTSATDVSKDWRPDKREPSSKIGTMPPFNRRVFHYSQPFDFSGIPWGWVHVGLSLSSYDRSVQHVYQRTAILAVVCIVLSLIASVIYAKRLVRPILDLRRVVEQVAGGDLSVRAEIESRDELGSLGNSVNAMTEALLRRDRILQSVRFAAQQFLSTADWNQALNEALANVGQAAGVSRAFVFENFQSVDGALVSSIRFEWTLPGIKSVLNDPRAQAIHWAELGLLSYANALQRGEIVIPRLQEIPPASRKLVSADVESSIAVPIRVGGRNWGFMSFEDCTHARNWSAPEVDSFRAAADILGAAIERRQAQDALIEAKENLEVRVRRRTKELQEQVEVTERALAKLAETQQSLMDMSRHAGMAEVATGVLHNVGNVLNSVNVSATLVTERMRSSRVARVRQLSDLLESHVQDLPAFLTNDPAGKQVPGYLKALADNLSQEQAGQMEELASLRKNIEHIKDIVAMQQSYARVSGFIESVSLATLVDDALNLNAESLNRRSVEVQRDYQPLPVLLLDKHRVLQILINVIRNAGHALETSELSNRRITVRVGPAEKDRVRVEVQDNGIGISPENLTRVFQHGFTTRRGGHGFGLHSGALAAKEMGGSLVAQSEGTGRGATFILELPVTLAPKTTTIPGDTDEARAQAADDF